MGVMILPIIASLSEDAIHAVPAVLREGVFRRVRDEIRLCVEGLSTSLVSE